MDKKKVKELIEQAEQLFDKSGEDGFNGFQARVDAKNCLKEAKEELSKSDWVSVEDRLPEYGEYVWARGSELPKDIYTTCRYNNKWEEENYRFDKYGFISYYSITHWKPIEKLEE